MSQKSPRAKSKPRPQPEFFEALPLAGHPVVQWGPAASLDWEDLGHQTGALVGQAARGLLKAIRSLAHALIVILRLITNRTARRIYLVLFGLGIVGVGATAAIIASSTMSYYANDLSNPNVILNKKDTGTTILDRNGQVLYQVYGANNRQSVTLDQVPKPMIDATLAAEDPGFYQHPGFSLRSTIRALVDDVIHRGKLQGGSTITQQLVKNSLLTPDKSYIRKYQEILLASALEQRYSKNQIMQMYLNDIYYGQGSYGIESAAQTYFHKSTKDLTLSQAALLAGLPQAPSLYDPNVDLNAAIARRNYVLSRMGALGMITSDQIKVASAEPIAASSHQLTLRAPHFVFYVLDQLRQQYGNDLVENGGITVTTTLDLSKQATGETAVRQQIDKLGSHHVTNGGLISIDPTNGQILAMVGSVDYNQPQFGNVNVTLANLQPGSSFKPFAYVTAFEKGWTGATIVPDLPASFPSGDGTTYTPTDYDGKWRGPVTLRRALANSLNLPAIHVMQFTGLPSTIATAHALGITTLNDPSRYGLSLVLGSGEVRPLDMATAYGVFATGGVKHDPVSILKITDRYGQPITLKSLPGPGTNVLDPRYAYMITNILSDNRARTEEFGPNSPLKLSRPAAAKTGTTSDFRDNWTVGYTPDLVTAVWVGNNDHTPMANVDGITGAAPIWHQFMESALAGTAVHDFVAPTGLTTATICTLDGNLANPWDTSVTTEIFLTTAVPTKHCSSPQPPPPTPPTDQAQPPAATTPSDTGNGNGAPTPPGGGGPGQPQPKSP